MMHKRTNRWPRVQAPLVRTPLQFFSLAWGSVATLLGLLLRGDIADDLEQRYCMFATVLLVVLLFTIWFCFMRLATTQPKIFGMPVLRRGSNVASAVRAQKPD